MIFLHSKTHLTETNSVDLCCWILLDGPFYICFCQTKHWAGPTTSNICIFAENTKLPWAECVDVKSEYLKEVTCAGNIAGCVHFTDEKLQANNSIDDDDEQDEEGDVKEWDHGFNDGVQHHL